MEDGINKEKLAKLQAQSRNVGKGQPRRKGVRKPKAAAGGGDDKKLQAALKKLPVQPVQQIEEVNMFKEDNQILHFSQPRAVHTAPNANTFAVYGKGEEKDLGELIPGILNQLGPESLANLRKLAESYQSMQGGASAAAAAAGEREADDDVPDLVQNFDVDETKEGDKETSEKKLDEVN